LKCSELITRACCAPRYHWPKNSLANVVLQQLLAIFWQNVL